DWRAGLASRVALRCGAVAGLASSLAAAQTDDPTAVETHAFVSQGYIKSTDNNYLAPSERGSYEFTEVGLNFTMRPSDSLRLGVQLFARDLGPLGNLEPTVDWFYFD